MSAHLKLSAKEEAQILLLREHSALGSKVTDLLSLVSSDAPDFDSVEESVVLAVRDLGKASLESWCASHAQIGTSDLSLSHHGDGKKN